MITKEAIVYKVEKEEWYWRSVDSRLEGFKSGFLKRILEVKRKVSAEKEEIEAIEHLFFWTVNGNTDYIFPFKNISQFKHMSSAAINDIRKHLYRIMIIGERNITKPTEMDIYIEAICKYYYWLKSLKGERKRVAAANKWKIKLSKRVLGKIADKRAQIEKLEREIKEVGLL